MVCAAPTITAVRVGAIDRFDRQTFEPTNTKTPVVLMRQRQRKHTQEHADIADEQTDNIKRGEEDPTLTIRRHFKVPHDNRQKKAYRNTHRRY